MSAAVVDPVVTRPAAGAAAPARAPVAQREPVGAEPAPRARRRAVVVAGARTPFAKAFGELAALDSLGLAVAAVRGLLERTALDPRAIDEVVWGSVVVSTQSPNLARELVFDLNLPRSIPGVTVTRACLSGLEAITQAAQMIERGDREVVVAGGSDSVSNAEVPMPARLVQALGKLSYGGRLTAGKLWEAIRSIGSPKELLPRAPRIAERSTGLTMGQHADDMARKNGIPREAQDAFALRSHARAHAAIESGRFDQEVVPVEVPGGRRVAKDTLVRAALDPQKAAQLKPAFRRDGTVTAASSSPLTDGASAVLLMSEDKARALGFPADVAIVDWSTVALDPFDQLLLGPALALPRLLERRRLALGDLDVVEIHEAFAAQVLSVLEALASESFCRERLGRPALGRIADERLNPHGGSIAIGHPFAATGGRLVATAANELRRTGAPPAAIAICAAGAMGGAALLERV